MAATRFARTPHVARKERAQAVAQGAFALMAAAMVVPLVLIVGYLVYLAWPSLGWEFLVDVPRRGQHAGEQQRVGIVQNVNMSVSQTRDEVLTISVNHLRIGRHTDRIRCPNLDNTISLHNDRL